MAKPHEPLTVGQWPLSTIDEISGDYQLNLDPKAKQQDPELPNLERSKQLQKELDGLRQSNEFMTSEIPLIQDKINAHQYRINLFKNRISANNQRIQDIQRFLPNIVNQESEAIKAKLSELLSKFPNLTKEQIEGLLKTL
jgi:peptidoglycan hydrolase CwlO-like protein